MASLGWYGFVGGNVSLWLWLGGFLCSGYCPACQSTSCCLPDIGLSGPVPHLPACCYTAHHDDNGANLWTVSEPPQFLIRIAVIMVSLLSNKSPNYDREVAGLQFQLLASTRVFLAFSLVETIVNLKSTHVPLHPWSRDLAPWTSIASDRQRAPLFLG